MKVEFHHLYDNTKNMFCVKNISNLTYKNEIVIIFCKLSLKQ